MRLYSLLLVDDEELERESISQLIRWGDYDIDFWGAVKNGVEALQIIEQREPDIVITDIKMPVVTGIDLIEQVHQKGLSTIFVVLSGYGDYEYTSKAMLLGVRHYLLKPVSEEHVIQALEDVKHDIRTQQMREMEVQSLRGNLEKVLPHVRDQFLRGCALTQIYNESDMEYFQKLFEIPNDDFFLAVLYTDKPCEFINKYALQNMAEEIIGWDCVALHTIIENQVVLVIDGRLYPDFEKQIQRLHRAYGVYFDMPFYAAASDVGAFSQIHSMYTRAVGLLKYRFQVPENYVIRDELLRQLNLNGAGDIAESIEKVCQLAKSGTIDELNFNLEVLFKKIEIGKLPFSAEKGYYWNLIRALSQAADKADDECRENLAALDHLTGLTDTRRKVKAIVNDVAEHNYRAHLQGKNPVVESILNGIYENISNPNLSLNWMAHTLLFMNEEYLGRMFYKQMHEKFSHFVLRTRIEMAKKLLENTNGLKIYEISQMVGFAEDAQYFGRVFKSFTHSTPSQYKENTGKNK